MYGCMDIIDVQMDVWMYGYKMYRCVDARMHGCIDDVDGWMDAWMHGCLVG